MTHHYDPVLLGDLKALADLLLKIPDVNGLPRISSIVLYGGFSRIART